MTPPTAQTKKHSSKKFENTISKIEEVEQSSESDSSSSEPSQYNKSPKINVLELDKKDAPSVSQLFRKRRYMSIQVNPCPMNISGVANEELGNLDMTEGS